VSVYKNIDFTVDSKVSLFSLIKELNSPETRRGLAVGLKFLKNLSTLEEQNNKENNFKQIN
jgi:uncharacterized protein YjgD (DUF1641 family)